MRFLMLTLIVAIGAFSMVEAKEKKVLSKEEKAKLILKYTGGNITKLAVGKITVFNMQDKIPEDLLKSHCSIFLKPIGIPYEFVKTNTIPVNEMKARVGLHKANAAVFIVDNQNLPLTLFAPEASFGILNVFSIDNTKLKDLGRMIQQTFVLSLGGIFSPSSKEYKMLPDLAFCMMGHLPKIGIIPSKITTYRQACLEGWAPTPTNEYQKAIWDKVHAIPQKPMKIEFDPKKGR